jgi:CRISPR-associated endonuclease/helicase Cas3
LVPEKRGELDVLLWGKSKGLEDPNKPYPLVWHLADTVALVLALWDGYVSPGQRTVIANGLDTTEDHARQLVAFWAGLHDVGKATPPFQSQVEKPFDRLRSTGRYADRIPDARLPHNRASQIVAVNMLANIGYATRPWKASPAYRCAQILGGHHGRFASESELYCREVLRRCPPVGDGEWQVQRELLFTTMYEVTERPPPPERITAEAAVLITALVILADWLASQGSFLRARQQKAAIDLSTDGVAKHVAATLALAPGLLSDAGLGTVNLEARTFQEAFNRPAPNPLQQSLIDEFVSTVTGPGLLLVTAATGHGKTEAALHASQALAERSGATGLYFATMATANEMHKRVRRFAERCATGAPSLTLLHSMAWLNTDYTGQSLDAEVTEVDSDDEGRGAAPLAPSEWLRGRNRGLLANLSVGTIDQALMAVLRAKHSVLRMLGLSSKVFIIDEAHAYDAYMQRLLKLLLNWLGRMRCPVVLLSATLPSSVARHLISAYAVGAGRPIPEDASLQYPGWLFVPADVDQNPVEISQASRQAVEKDREFTLDVDVRPVRQARAEGEPAPGTRLAAIRETLHPIAQQGGCAAVVCNTVEDAQRTYLDLRDWLSSKGFGCGLTLLHARMPAYERAARTEALVKEYGERGSRAPGIVVATQVIEQSLDLDFDLMVSDLAPISLLLQRAGRCQRHRDVKRPRLVVLDPHSSKGEFAVPRHWGEVYAHHLLRATHHVLSELGGTPVKVPDDVERLVEAVYELGLGGAAGLGEDPAAPSEYIQYQADEQARSSIAEFNGVPSPRTLRDLGALHEQEVADVEVATRFGAESQLVLACYVDQDGNRWLDPECQKELPLKGTGPRGRFTDDEVRDVLRRSIPLRSTYLKGVGAEHAPPPQWRKNVWLRDVTLLPHRVTAEGTALATVGKRTVHLDPELGVVIGASR